MDAWSEALLSQRPNHSGGEQEGPEERRAHAQGAGQDETGVFLTVEQRDIADAKVHKYYEYIFFKK